MKGYDIKLHHDYSIEGFYRGICNHGPGLSSLSPEALIGHSGSVLEVHAALRGPEDVDRLIQFLQFHKPCITKK